MHGCAAPPAGGRADRANQAKRTKSINKITQNGEAEERRKIDARNGWRSETKGVM